MKATLLVLKVLINLSLFVVIVIGIKVLTVTINSGNLSYQFAFITSNQLAFINPSSIEDRPTSISLDPPNRAIFALSSPDGKWIAIARHSIWSPNVPSDSSIQIYDVVARKMLPLIHIGNGFLSDHQEVGDPAKDISWSSDSKFLGLNMIAANHDGADIFVFSVITNSVTDITESDPGWHYNIAWANTSDHLITIKEADPSDRCCAATLDLMEFDINGQRLKSIDVTNLYTGDFFPGGSICNMRWSPTDAYLSFQSSCQSQSMAPIQGIYLWDQSANKIQSVTHVSKTNVPNANGQWTEYNTLWLNNDQILVSILTTTSTYTISMPFLQTRTFTYQPSQSLQTTISTDYFDNWSLKPVSGQLAYNMIQLDTTNPNAPATSSVKLATIDSNSSNANILQDQPAPLMAQIPDGCDLAWSPDGRYLAFASGPDLAFTTSSQCNVGHVTSIGFVDTQSNTIKEYPLPADSRTRYYVPIGWVVAPGQSNPAATTSPTEIGSPATPGSGSVPGGNQIGG